MPTYPHIERYHADLQRFIKFGGSDNEQSIRRAFAVCLDSYCRDHREELALVDELDAGYRNRPDGTVKDRYRMARGYWEAKDSHDDLDAEIQAKFDRGYPRDNILFEDSLTAVLYQNGQEVMQADMAGPRDLERLIHRFLGYELPEIGEFREARQQFQTDLPAVLDDLRAVVDSAASDNADFRDAAEAFLATCHQTISPDLSDADVREMLLQHILTKDIFSAVFQERQFHRLNNIARQLDDLEETFFTDPAQRRAMGSLQAYYRGIGSAAWDISDYAEKQHFLKSIYEDFYQAYNPAAADRLGVVYTPNEVVDFIVRGADHLLKKHFGRTLADDNVQILDPATGTGTFITSLINHLPADRLEYKYLNETHANEVAILPYYIANLNIEYTYKERTDSYLEFPNLCFVDTLDNMDWKGASGATVQRQGALNLGALSPENLKRVQRQNEKLISVIIGNPPYNANQRNENDNNKNREYPAIDRRISETYVAASTAQKTKQYDMYKRFIRWASDRLDDDGIIGFVSNSAFLDARQDDGFRKVVAEEFNELWVIDLKGNARSSGERRRREGGNVFSDKIRVGVAIYFLVRRNGLNGFRVFYNAVDDYAKAHDKIVYIENKDIDSFDFSDLSPDAKSNWLDQSDTDFDGLVHIADRQTKNAKSSEQELAVFKLSAPGVNTARDEWVYDFNPRRLRDKALFFADVYNELLEGNKEPTSPVIKWSDGTKDKFRRRQHIVYNEAHLVETLYRPFVVKHYFAEPIMSDRLTGNHRAMFGKDLRQPNKVICVREKSKGFYALATNKLADWHFTGDTQCLPLHRYTGGGDRVINITDWGLRRFKEQYEEDTITAEDIFAYVYAMLHDPAYRQRYEVDLRREFPRVYFHDDFGWWAERGQTLLDLHLGFETAVPYRLERRDAPVVANDHSSPSATLRADKERGIITLDERTILAGVPAEAWEYRLGSRSALEWILEQYKEQQSDDPTIRERFNTYHLADHKDRVIDLLLRVCTVSVETQQIVEELNLHTSIDTDEGRELRPEF